MGLESTQESLVGGINLVPDQQEGCQRFPGNRWVVLFGSWLAMVSLAAAYASAAFVSSVQEEFHVGRGIASFSATLGLCTTCIGCIFSGRLSERYGLRKILIIGTVISSAALFGSAFTHDITWFCLLFGALSGFGFALMYMPVLTIQQDWFPDRMGMAYGITSSGISAGSIMWSEVASWSLEHKGWRWGTKLIALIVLGGGLVSAALTRKRTVSTSEQYARHQAVRTDMPLLDLSLCGNKAFFVFMLSQTLTGFVFYAPFSQMVVYAEDQGVSKIESPRLISALAVGSLIGRLSMGYLGDIFNPLSIVHLLILLSCGGCVAWVFAHSYLFCLILSVFLGIVLGGLVPAVSASVGKFVAPRDIDAAMGLVWGVTWTPGSLLIALLMGKCKEITNSYNFVLYGLISGSAIATVLSVLSQRMAVPQPAYQALDPLVKDSEGDEVEWDGGDRRRSQSINA